MEPRIDMFTKVTERRDIVDFVKEVEKYPCLYNRTIPEYANKIHIRRAWAAIAKKSNTAVIDCREKWRKIRISFMRSLKLLQSDKPPLRPYYLADDLQFLVPFIVINKKKNLNSVRSRSPMDEPVLLQTPAVFMTKHEVISDADSVDESFDSDKHNTLQIIEPMTKEVNNQESVKHNGYYDDIESNPRKMFLLSILPDVESFTEQEMRQFRRETVNVIDHIINKREAAFISNRKHM